MTTSSKDTPTEAVATLLNRLNTKFTSHSLKSLQQHPDYPSLLAISHTLDQLQIDSIAVRGTYEQLQHEFPKPLLVHTRSKKGAYQVIDALDENQVHFVDPYGKLKTQPKADFLRTWSGVVLLVDKENPGKEPNYSINKVKSVLHQITLPGATVALLMLISYILYHTNSITSSFDYLFLLTKALGVIVTFPLMIRLIDHKNSWVEELCRSEKSSIKSDCSNVLDTPAANFLGVFAWSEIGFLYFTSLFLYILLFQVHSNIVVAVTAALAAPAPYTMYSIYYQWKIVQQWCRMCLAVQAVLLLELGLALAFFANYSFSTVSEESLIALILIAAIVITSYGLLKPVLIAAKRAEQELPQLSRIKYNQEVFQLLLNKYPSVNTAKIVPIQLKNPKGKHRLTVISSPTCGPCIKMHHQLFEILKDKEEASLEEIFLTSKAEDSDSYRIAVCMIALYQTADMATVEKAMVDYYQAGRDRSNFAKWMQHYDRDGLQKDEAKQILRRHIAWCSERNIIETPIIFYNGHKLPPDYTVEDLAYLLH